MKIKTALVVLAILLVIGNIYGQKPIVKNTPNPTVNGKTSSDNRLQADSPIKFSGTFIQFNDGTQKMNAEEWLKFLEKMYQDAQIDTIIIQRLGFHDATTPSETYIKLKTGTLDPSNPQYQTGMVVSPDDSTEAILKFADSTQKLNRPMKVFVGLWMEQGKDLWDYDTPLKKTPQQLKDYLDTTADRNNKYAVLASALYGQHPSFKGWYFPQEYWNFPFDDPIQQPLKVEKLQKLQDFLVKISTKCKALDRPGSDPRLVAISPYFNPWLDTGVSGPERTSANYSQILTDSGVDIVMVQDGVGARCLDKEPLDNQQLEAQRKAIKEGLIYDYFYAFSSAFEAAKTKNPKMELWANLESFEGSPGGCKTDRPEALLPYLPTNIARLKWQFTVASYTFNKFVSFDLFHYMNPITPDGFGTAGKFPARSSLYADYKKNFIDQEFKP